MREKDASGTAYVIYNTGGHTVVLNIQEAPRPVPLLWNILKGPKYGNPCEYSVCAMGKR